MKITENLLDEFRKDFNAQMKGIVTRSRKYLILALCSDGTSYKLPGYSVNAKK